MKRKDAFIAYDSHGDSYIVSVHICLNDSQKDKIEIHLENGERVVYVEKGVYKTNEGFILKSNDPDAP